jgi:O-antigen/teichoic acid export membrane protein
MADHRIDTKRLAKNTMFLYLRSLFSMVVGIYTSSVVLSALGLNDYGIYSFIGGIVALLQIVSSTFVAATQRSLTFEIGRKNIERTQQIFSASLNVHIIVSIIIVVLIEIIGVWFVNFKANIPVDRVNAANWVLQFSIAAFVLNFISIPYNALLISKEKMSIFALVGIFESIAKLVIVYFLYATLFDRLIFYSVLIFVVAIVVRMFYGLYCKKHFVEAKYTKVEDNSIYKEQLNLSGWVFLGSSASILTSEGISVLINLFFNVAINAAKGIAGQLESVVTMLVNNFTMSLRPQITKSYSANEKEYLYRLIDKGSRLAFFLMAVCTVPIFILSKELLTMWLKVVPPYTEEFLRLIMIYIMFQPLKTILDTLLIATGDVKNWQICSFTIDIVNLPFCYLVYKLGFPPYASYLVMIPINLISLSNRIYFCYKKTEFDYIFYLKNTILRSFFSWIIPIVILYHIKSFFPVGVVWSVLMGMISVIFTIVFIAIFGLNKTEFNMVKSKIISYIPFSKE